MPISDLSLMVLNFSSDSFKLLSAFILLVISSYVTKSPTILSSESRSGILFISNQTDSPLFKTQELIVLNSVIPDSIILVSDFPNKSCFSLSSNNSLSVLPKIFSGLPTPTKSA